MLPADARCLGCRYPLEGVADLRCPECGRAFDPTDRLTFSVPYDDANWHRRLLRGPAWIFNSAGVAAGAVLIWAFSPPAGSHHELMLLGLSCASLIGLCWFTWACMALAAAQVHGGFVKHILPRRRRWLTLPAVSGLILLLLLTGATRHARFAIARPTLGSIAEQMLKQPAGSPPLISPSVPLMSIRYVQVQNGVVLFHIDEVGFLEHPVLVLVPAGVDPSSIAAEVTRLRHFTGSWHVGWQEY